jgi:hypothetical protein
MNFAELVELPDRGQYNVGLSSPRPAQRGLLILSTCFNAAGWVWGAEPGRAHLSG